MGELENTKYQIFEESHPRTILHEGSIWECEKWVTKNGAVGDKYVIEQITKESIKRRQRPSKALRNEVESLF